MKFVKVQVIPLDRRYDYEYEVINLERIDRIQKKINLNDGIQYAVYFGNGSIRVSETVGKKLLEMIGMSL